MFEWLSNTLTTLMDVIFTFPVIIYDALLDALAGLLNLLPLPDFMTGFSMQAKMQPIDEHIGFYLAQMDIGTALTILISAAVARFLFSLIPVIGSS